ncbi:MAG: biopolymer transporter ExbD [Ferruginibacter sp.]
MSEIENKSAGKRSSKNRSSKRTTRVDLTPMVDLGFLLITFFVFTTQLSQPTVMNLNMPFDKVEPGDKVPESTALTVMLKDHNIIQYYEGAATPNSIIGTTEFSPAGIRNIILQKKAMVKKMKSTGDEFVLIIKASDESTFQNFVNIVDEVTINNVKHYYLAEIDPIDKILFHLK